VPHQNLVLQTLPSAILDTLKARLQPRVFTAGQVLFANGDKVNSIYFPTAGAISLVTDLTTGEMTEFAIIGRDSMVAAGAALDNRDASYRAVVQVEGAGYALDVVTARHVALEREDFRTIILRHEQLILAQALQSVACSARHDLEQRLSRWLLRVRDATGSDDFMLTQELMADMLGVRRTSITMIAQSLQKSGFISYRRGRVAIKRWDALQELACECYFTIKGRYDHMPKVNAIQDPFILE
jgi:CRP-like cAMP-binding protein